MPAGCDARESEGRCATTARATSVGSDVQPATARAMPVGHDVQSVTAGAMPVALLLPDTWWSVDLADPAHVRRSVDALVRRQVGRGDRRARLRAELRSRLHRTAGDARRAGGFLLAVSLMRASEHPIPASLTAYRAPRGDGLESLEAELAGLDSDALDLAVADRGDLLRRVWRRAGPTDLDAEDVEMLRADYWLALPDAPDLVLLSFSSPLVAAAEGLLELFDVIVATVGIPARPLAPPPAPPGQPHPPAPPRLHGPPAPPDPPRR